ncbi:beta-aspartyl-peptidase [Curvivirga sp.]|uniref:beta-aspartyl-peptidase n=1 Tax=Curvivirga sp. TaxID=2856848 RepID=UPI003B5A2ACA
MLHLIRNAHLYSPKDEGICHILTAYERILYIGKEQPDIDKKLIATDTDIEGARLLPGFIDGHAHITGGGGETGPASRVPAIKLSEFTSAGVTSVIGLLGTDDLTRNTETLVQQAYGLREEGLSAWCYTGGYHVPPITLTEKIRGDIVFVDPIIGVGELAISDHRSSQPTFDEFLRIASEVHVAGLMTGKAGVLHLHLGDGQRHLELVEKALDVAEIPARTYNPTHVNRNIGLFEAALALPERGVTIDLTAFPKGDCGHGLSAADAFLQYHQKGLPLDKISISSDGGGCLPQFDEQGELLHIGVGTSSTLPETLDEVLKQDIPLEEILPTMTSNVADSLRLSHKGRLETGKDADLVILSDQNEIQHVMARGKWHIRDGSAVIKGTFE